MMTLLEYAEDVSKSVEEIITLCEKLGINKTNEDDLLDQDEITMLDSELANVEIESSEEIVEETESNNDYDDDDEFFEKVESLAQDTKMVNEKQKTKIKPKKVVNQANQNEFLKDKKEMLKYKDEFLDLFNSYRTLGEQFKQEIEVYKQLKQNKPHHKDEENVR